MIESLNNNEVFIFGSNLLGSHAGGAARQAKEQFGAGDGVGEGITGQCYAFPTLDIHMQRRTIGDLMISRDKLYKVAEANKHKEFLLTPVGTGIAGYSISLIRDLFIELPKNITRIGNWNSDREDT